MTDWMYLQLDTIVQEVINFEYDYYCQIHSMKPTFMHIGQYAKFHLHCSPKCIPHYSEVA